MLSQVAHWALDVEYKTPPNTAAVSLQKYYKDFNI